MPARALILHTLLNAKACLPIHNTFSQLCPGKAYRLLTPADVILAFTSGPTFSCKRDKGRNQGPDVLAKVKSHWSRYPEKYFFAHETNHALNHAVMITNDPHVFEWMFMLGFLHVHASLADTAVFAGRFEVTELLRKRYGLESRFIRYHTRGETNKIIWQMHARYDRNMQLPLTEEDCYHCYHIHNYMCQDVESRIGKSGRSGGGSGGGSKNAIMQILADHSETPSRSRTGGKSRTTAPEFSERIVQLKQSQNQQHPKYSNFSQRSQRRGTSKR